MAEKYKALVFDLGGVLLDWDRHSVSALTPSQFLLIMNSNTWHNLDRGHVTLEEACKVRLPIGSTRALTGLTITAQEFGNILGVDASIVETALEQAQLSLKPNVQLVETILDLKASNPGLKFYVMSNISRVSQAGPTCQIHELGA